MKRLVLLLVVCLGCTKVNGYGTGADPSACVDMTPGHGMPGSGPAEISITVTDGLTGGKYQLGSVITVQVSSPSATTFQGILLQARNDGSSTSLGTWSNPSDGFRTMDCSASDDSITHADNTTKTPPYNFTWTAPDDCEGDSVEFIATILQTKELWWKNQTTGIIEFDCQSTTTTSTPDNGGTQLYAWTVAHLSILTTLIAVGAALPNFLITN